LGAGLSSEQVNQDPTPAPPQKPWWKVYGWVIAIGGGALAFVAVLNGAFENVTKLIENRGKIADLISPTPTALTIRDIRGAQRKKDGKIVIEFVAKKTGSAALTDCVADLLMPSDSTAHASENKVSFFEGTDEKPASFEFSFIMFAYAYRQGQEPPKPQIRIVCPRLVVDYAPVNYECEPEPKVSQIKANLTTKAIRHLCRPKVATALSI
jgi:hypothetical protein